MNKALGAPNLTEPRIFKARCHCLRPYVPTSLPDLWTVRWLVVDSPRRRMSQVLWLSNMSWHLNCVYDGHRCQGTTPKFHCLLPLTRHGASTGWWTWGNVRGNKWQPASDAQASSFEAFQFGCCPLKHGPMGGVNLRVWGTGAGEVITPQSRLTATTPRSHKTTWWHSSPSLLKAIKPQKNAKRGRIWVHKGHRGRASDDNTSAAPKMKAGCVCHAVALAAPFTWDS